MFRYADHSSVEIHDVRARWSHLLDDSKVVVLSEIEAAEGAQAFEDAGKPM